MAPFRMFFFFRFAEDIKDMTGKKPWIGWRICWKYISPLALFIVLVATIYDLTEGTATYSAFVGCEQVGKSHLTVLKAFGRLIPSYTCK